jgi:hypothetical protein
VGRRYGDILAAPAESATTGEPAGAAGSAESDESIGSAEESAEGTTGTNGAPRRKRQTRSFPAMSFKEALFLADAIQKHGAGQPIRRLTLLEALERSPDSSATRKLITSGNQYGLTSGGYKAELLSLTPTGAIASDPASPEAPRLKARFDLAIDNVAPFKSIYEKYVGNRLPTVEALRDAAREAQVPDEYLAECVETFLANARDLGFIRTIAGSEHLVSVEAALDLLPGQASPMHVSTGSQTTEPSRVEGREGEPPRLHSAQDDLSNVCFIVSPIGDEDSIQRKHADLILSAFIEPALEALGMVAVRADRISKPGLITGQVIDHIVRSKLVIADLSFGNPNVYYELALRHAIRKPIVQLIRRGDPLPFDVGQFRTVEIDMTDIFTLVPQIDLHRQEITRQARAAMSDGSESESPLSRFYPRFWEHVAASN